MNEQPSIICFGEVLWDVLPSGTMPGGAPINVAYHLHRLGITPTVITRIGNDPSGQSLKDLFHSYGINTGFFQVDEEHETGKVYGQLKAANEMVYEIVQPVAWDFISWNSDIEQQVKQADYFVCGSLAARNATSRETLFRLLSVASRKVIDINLRAPHYTRDLVERLMQQADLLKLNEAELDWISAHYGNYSSITDQVRSLQDRFEISDIVVTLGDKGAVAYIDGQFARHPGFTVNVVDTVGSGDAFLAGLLTALLEDQPVDKALAFACSLGAFVATHAGACPVYERSVVEGRLSS